MVDALGGPVPRRVDAIDWAAWAPVDVATLMFVRSDGRVLLIRKRRGLGAGKINAPGGRLEAGESPLQAAVRETIEEVCIEPDDIAAHGELRFQFLDGYRLHAHLFVARSYRGEPAPTDEAIPHWFPVHALPFDEMWADDRLWVPELLDGRVVDGRFIFDGDLMVDHRLDVFSP